MLWCSGCTSNHWPGTYHTHAEIIQFFDTLVTSHPDLMDKVSVGKTYLSNDIWLYRIGNPDGGRYLADSNLHGWEDLGAETMSIYAEWLLDSHDPTAEEILARNWTLLVPVVNYDGTGRGNMHVHCNPTYCSNSEWGVDLNRNFKTGWNLVGCCTDTNQSNTSLCANPCGQPAQIICGDPTRGQSGTNQYGCSNGSWRNLGYNAYCDQSGACTSPTGSYGQIICGNATYSQSNRNSYQCINRTWVNLGYDNECDCERQGCDWWTYNDHCCRGYPNNHHGLSGASEPETQTMRYVYQTYQPRLYMNHHYGGGPTFGTYSGANNTSRQVEFKNLVYAYATELGVRSGYPYSFGLMGGGGQAIGDAYWLTSGYCLAWNLETFNRGAGYPGWPHCSGYNITTSNERNPPFEYCYDCIYPRVLPVYLAMAELSQMPIEYSGIDDSQTFTILVG